MLSEEDYKEIEDIVKRYLLTPCTVFADSGFSDGMRVTFKQNINVPNWPKAGEAAFYLKPLSAVAVSVEYNAFKDRFRIELGDPETGELGIKFNKPFSVERYLRGMAPFGWQAIQCAHVDLRVSRNIERQLPRCIAVPWEQYVVTDSEIYPDVDHQKPWLDRAMNVV